MTLSPVPNSNIVTLKDQLQTPWRAWFDALYRYLTASIPLLSPLASPAFTGTISLNGATIHTGYNSPVGLVAGNPGDLYLNLNGGTSLTLWVKETGTGTSGWVAK